MFVLKAKEKPSFAKRGSDDFYYRDRGRRDCEGTEGATKFETREDAESVAGAFIVDEFYEVVELAD